MAAEGSDQNWHAVCTFDALPLGRLENQKMQQICELPTMENGNVNTLPPLRQRRLSLATRVPRVQPRIESAAAKVQDLAQAVLRDHPHLRARGESVQIVCHANRLVLTGTVSSFYLKQLAQESVRCLGSGMTIDNQINVRYP